MTQTMPSINLAKIPVGSSGYAVDMVGPTTVAPNPADIGAFRIVCDFSHMAFDDPIVYPGQPGASHLHAFFGNTGTNANSTAASLASTGNSTCRGGTVNRTGYWTPAVIDTRTGAPVAPASLLAYYKTGYNGIAPSAVQAFPAGLRIIAGDSKATTPNPYGPAHFSCVNPATGVGTPWAQAIPNCASGNAVYAGVDFPQCWDGVNLDSPDHKSHMAYPSNGSCPATHPVPVPQISQIVIYAVGPNDSTPSWRLSSDAYDSKTPAGYSLHADWFNGWKTNVMNQWIKNCDQASADCGGGLIGNGQMLTGVGSF
jgi:hypothetical protein